MKRFIDCSVNTFACNLKCHYCYVAQNYLFTQKVPKFKYSAELVGKALFVCLIYVLRVRL